MSELLDAVIAAHGDLERWGAVRSIDVTFNFSGGLLELKGYPSHCRPTVSVDVSVPRTVFQRLGGDPDDRWIFATDRVWIEHRDGSIVGQRSDPRAAFAGHDASRQGTTHTHQTATTQFVEGSDGMVADDACCEMPSIARPSSSN